MKIEDCYVGQKVIYTECEPPEYIKREVPGEVTEVHFDYVVVNCPDISDHLLFDDDNSNLLNPI